MEKEDLHPYLLGSVLWKKAIKGASPRAPVPACQ